MGHNNTVNLESNALIVKIDSSSVNLSLSHFVKQSILAV